MSTSQRPARKKRICLPPDGIDTSQEGIGRHLRPFNPLSSPQRGANGHLMKDTIAWFDAARSQQQACLVGSWYMREALCLILSPENDYEYEFSQSRQTEAPRGQASDPATALAAFSHSTAAQEPAQEYEQESSYILNPVASVTRDFDRTKLSTVSEGPASTSNFAVNYNQGAGGSSSLNAGKPDNSPQLLSRLDIQFNHNL